MNLHIYNLHMYALAEKNIIGIKSASSGFPTIGHGAFMLS